MRDAPMSRARYVQENRKMRFDEAYQGWTGGRLTQAEAAMLLGQCERSFRRHFERFRADGLDGLLDRRLSQISKRRASHAEVDQVVQTYKGGFAGWEVAYFHSKYCGELEGVRCTECTAQGELWKALDYIDFTYKIIIYSSSLEVLMADPSKAPSKAPSKVRLNADLSPDVAAALKELASMQDVSLTEALSRAISTESVLAARRRQGAKVVIDDGSGKLSEVVFAR